MAAEASTVQSLIDEGAAHHEAGRLDRARASYERVLQRDPENAEALALLGLIERTDGNLDAAVELLQRAVTADDSWWSYHNDLGEALFQVGRFDDAIGPLQRATELNVQAFQPHFLLGMVLLRQGCAEDARGEFDVAVHIQPDSAEAWHLLGKACFACRSLEQAELAQKRALDLKIVYPEADHQLGLILHVLGRDEDSKAHLETALGLRPEDPQILADIAHIRSKKKDHRGAARMLERAVELRPDSFQLQWELSRVYWTLTDWQKTVDVLKKIIEMQPMLPMSHYLYGTALKELGSVEAAKAEMRRALDLGLRHPAAEFFANTLIGGHTAHSPSEVVIDLFDGYSANFEKNLVQDLKYQGHTMIEQAVLAVGVTPPLDVLDAGCGTGLCGALFKPMARRLIGVDLAPKMIEKSRERNIYDELIVGDAAEVIRRYPAGLDLILAGDVLIYIGEADEIFDAAAMALRPGGLFAFTIETNDQDGVRLMPTQRYQHSTSYIRRLAEARGMRELHSSSHVLRIERGAPVASHAIVIGKR
jgi:predicted TPR repeat methyltransferase